MKASKQRKMVRAIIKNKAIRHSEVTRITQAQIDLAYAKSNPPSSRLIGLWAMDRHQA